VTAGVASAEIPPLGLALCAAGSGLLVASYAYRYRSALGHAATSTVRAAFDAINPFD